jgi:hypothetical protein
MLRTADSLALTGLLSLLAAACAGTSGPAPAALAPETQAGTTAVVYTLNEEELGLDCKKLTGRMQVRILQIRDYETAPKTTLLARALQSVSTTVLGGPKEGTSPASRNAQDRAVLAAYNRRLAAMGCPTFDLEAELSPKDVKHTPEPVPGSQEPAATVAPAE